ncbi:MAG: MMPL family transporter [Pseudomonadota bacterium]
MKRQTWFALAWALVVCALVGHNAYLWLGKHIVPNTDILALLPVQERDPILQRSFTQMVDSAQQRVIVLVGAREWPEAQRAAKAYGDVLDQHPELFEPIKLSGQVEADWLAPFQPHRLALLTPGQEAQLRSAPPQFWTDAALAKLYSAFAGPKLGAFRDDPFDLFSGWVQQRAQETPVRPRDGSLFVADATHQYSLLPMTLKVPAFSLTAQQQVIPLLAKAGAAARAAVPDAQVIQAGVVLHAAAAGAQAEGEVSTIGVGSLIGIVLLTWFAFRSLRPIGLILLSIGIGFLGSLSICWLLFGGIHLMTLVFGASLIGIAQDYGIYFLCNRLSADPSLDSASLLKRLLPGLFLTMLAAVIAYLGLALTPFPGLRHMAVFSAVGLVFAWLTVVCWFPSLIGPNTLKTGLLARYYCATLERWPRLRLNATSLVAMALFLAAAAWGWSRLGVNDDIRSLQTPPKHLIDDQIKLGKLLDAPTPVQYFLVRGASAEAVLQREEALKRRLDPLVDAKSISGYQALSNWVPSQKLQAERRALVQSALLQEGGPLDALAKAIEEDAAWAAATRAHLLTATAPMTVATFLKTPPSEPWRHLWLGETAGVHASIVAVRGLSLATLPKLREAGTGLEGVQWVDKVAEISSVLGRYRQYMGWVVLGAYIVVLGVLFPRYRRSAWRVVAPVATASIATLALLGFAGQALQMFHVLALMLLLGVGIDYGIFMQENAGRRDSTPWLAVGLSAVSTILSFGLLGLSRTPALQAFGSTMLIGTTLAWLLTPFFAKRYEGPNEI